MGAVAAPATPILKDQGGPAPERVPINWWLARSQLVLEQPLLRRWWAGVLIDQHRIAETVEAIAQALGLFVSPQDEIPSG